MRRKIRNYVEGIVDKKMTRNEERDLAIKLLDDGFFWLNNTLCEVHSITRNERHYFINYKDSISAHNITKNIIVSQLKEVKL